jgi:plastocyanin
VSSHAGGTATSSAPSTSGSGSTNVGSAENPPREVPLGEEPGAGGTPSGPAHLQVSAKEFSLTLSRPSTTAGRLMLELVNAGQDEHNLHIRPAAGGPDVGALGIVLPGHHSDVEFQLKPGTYTLYCAIPAHEELGMKATLTVQ